MAVGLYFSSLIVIYQAFFISEYFSQSAYYWWNWRFQMGTGLFILASCFLGLYYYGIKKFSRRKQN
ncbi:hypothetical protein C3K47_19300 [Solitalea longa]|uniref:Uncharacterized protein n=1 Tax=Solitalea longa TaxID=2079460 RepID=A0A2S4ZWG8_9SPHI|nr:hypothetical protein C3K47_19300 [Solitalea longa]